MGNTLGTPDKLNLQIEGIQKRAFSNYSGLIWSSEATDPLKRTSIRNMGITYQVRRQESKTLITWAAAVIIDFPVLVLPVKATYIQTQFA